MAKCKQNASIVFNVTGVTFEGRAAYVAMCSAGTKLNLIDEPTNQFDENAIAVYTEPIGDTQPRTAYQLGYVPASFTGLIRHIRKNYDFNVIIAARGIDPTYVRCEIAMTSRPEQEG